MKNKQKNTPKLLNEWIWPVLLGVLAYGGYKKYQEAKKNLQQGGIAGEDDDEFDDDSDDEDAVKGSDLFRDGSKKGGMKGSDLFGGGSGKGGTKGSDLFGGGGQKIIAPSIKPPKSKSYTPRIRYKKCSKNLKLGCVGDNVKDMQGKLVSCGFPLPLKGEDGFFGPETLQSVKNFQDSFSIESNGIVDSKTFDALSRCKKISRSVVSTAKSEETKKVPSLDSDSVLQERNKKIENLVFKRLVQECK